jgi:hypothetical protein
MDRFMELAMQLVEEWDFDSDDEVNGPDVVDWLIGFRGQCQEAFRELATLPPDKMTDKERAAILALALRPFSDRARFIPEMREKGADHRITFQIEGLYGKDFLLRSSDFREAFDALEKCSR